MAQILFTIEEAAHVLNVKVSRLRSAVFKKEIGHIKLNRLVRFTQAHLEEWIKRGEVSQLN
jgi:excisionase family DNA binding protein